MITRMINYILAVIWFLLIVASLQIKHIDLPPLNFCFEEYCFPHDSAAVISIHAFWLTLFVPGAIIIAKSSNFLSNKKFWILAGVVSLVGWVVVYGVSLATQFPTSLPINPKLIAFFTLTNTDFPFVHFAIACVAGWVVVMLTGKPNRELELTSERDIEAG